MLRFINYPCRRAFPTLCALLFSSFLAEPAHAFGKKPVVVPPKPPVTPTPPPATPDPSPTDPSEIIRGRWEASQRDGAAWSKHVFERIPALAPRLLTTLPKDIAQFCPAYKDLNERDKRNFWVHLISSMSEFESNHKPETSYTEAFYDAQGRRVVSRGLLQISIESGNGYGCGLKDANELHDPLINLDCGLRILNKWVGNDVALAGQSGSTWQGGARYWSVLRKDPALGKIKAWNAALRICGN